MRKFCSVVYRIESGMARPSYSAAESGSIKDNKYNIQCGSYTTLRMPPLMHHSFVGFFLQNFFSIGETCMLVAKWSGCREGGHFSVVAHQVQAGANGYRKHCARVTFGLGNTQINA